MTMRYPRETLSIDQQLALGAVDHLAGDRAIAWSGGSDPAGLDLAAVRPIRDEIERRVRDLLDDMHVPAHA